MQNNELTEEQRKALGDLKESMDTLKQKSLEYCSSLRREDAEGYVLLQGEVAQVYLYSSWLAGECLNYPLIKDSLIIIIGNLQTLLFPESGFSEWLEKQDVSTYDIREKSCKRQRRLCNNRFISYYQQIIFFNWLILRYACHGLLAVGLHQTRSTSRAFTFEKPFKNGKI